MIAIWMLRLVAAAALVALAARAAEEVARGFGWPRRWVWAGALLLVVTLPWLGGLLPGLSLVDALIDRLQPTATVGMPVVAADAGAVGMTARSEAPGALFDALLVGAWMLTSLTVAVVFGRALWRVRTALRRGGARARVGGTDVVRCDALGPATVGVLRPKIVLPRWVDELPPAERELIMSHEREHATARDPLLLAASALVVVAAPWCLPLWWMHRRLRDATEADCDARVLVRCADRLVYGRALLHAAGRPWGGTIRFAAPLFGGLSVTRLERRILTMTSRRPKRPILRAIPLTALAAIGAVVACDAAGDAVTATEEPQVPDQSSEGVSAVSARRDTVLYPRPGVAELRDTVVYFPARRIEIRGTVVEIGAERERVSTRPTAVLEEAGRALSVSAETDPVFYIDGERIDDHRAALSKLDPTTIERIEVEKGKLVALYPPDHAAGVVHIYTKNRN